MTLHPLGGGAAGGVTAGQSRARPRSRGPLLLLPHTRARLRPQRPRAPRPVPEKPHGRQCPFSRARAPPCTRSALCAPLRLPLCSHGRRLFCSPEVVCSQDSHCGYPGACSSQALARRANVFAARRGWLSGVTAGHRRRACAAPAQRLRACKPHCCISSEPCEKNRNASPSCTTITLQSRFQ